ncbi:hypothetical protein F5884DRAFT_106048 [Xylogone sp. PMI_703]|nr:hypothetical protein F5884DRAFT_106048 [Xylogone sp. PMI_703]
MPHTNRKNKSQAQQPLPQPRYLPTKRQEILDADGWTHVVESPRTRPRATATKGNDNQQPLHGGDFTLNGVSYINRTLEEMKEDHDYYQKQWEDAEAIKEVKDKFSVEQNKGKDLKLHVRNVVCLGLGSLQSSRREGRRASHTQLAALKSVLDQFQSTTNETLQCFFQDPQFTPLDKEFLVSLGYTVVEDPIAFSHVDEHTLVYAIHCYADVYAALSKGPRPTILIGTDVNNFGRFSTSEEAAGKASDFRDMVKDCEESNFPQVRHDFSDTKIYWRRNEEITS